MFGRRRPGGSSATGPAGAGYFAPAAVPSPRAAYAPETLTDRARNWLKLSLTGGAGILAAVLTDLQHRGDNSALFVVARTLAGAAAVIGLASMPLYAVILLLMGVGAAVVLYFRPRGLRPAFMTGFGSLAALTTMVPGYSGEAIGSPEAAGAEAPVPVIEEGELTAAAPWANEARIAVAGFAAAEADAPPPALKPAPARRGYTLRVRMTFPDGVPEPIALRIKEGRLKTRLYDPARRKAYNLFLSAGGPVIRDGDTLQVETTIPADTPDGTLMLRVEADGYEIDVSEFRVSTGENAAWEVTMTPTDEPLILQRLKHTYAF